MRRAVPALIVAGLVMGGAPGVGAQTGNGDQQQQLQAQVAQLDQAQTAALGKLNGIQQQKASIDARVASLNSQLSTAQAQLSELDASVATLEHTISITQAKLDEARRRLDTSAAGLYISVRIGDQFQAMWAAKPENLLAQNKYLDKVTGQRKDLLAQVSVLRRDLEQEHTTAVTDEVKAKAARDQIASAVAQLAPAETQAAQQGAAVQATLTQIQGTKSQDQTELAAYAAASSNHAQQGSRGTASRPCQARPVPGAIESPYGPRGGSFHAGDDMQASYGDPIHACLSGTVIGAGSDGGYGNDVLIDHGGGMATLYAHQSRIGVSVGQQVSAGQVIGYVGCTGYCTGPHLHFEVHLNGNAVDPAPYL